MKQKQKGFTLIELIVVMAIIAILVLLAAPRFMGYTEKAKLTKVINDIKVSEKAAEQYYLQYDAWPRDQLATPYTVAQLNDWVDDFRNLSGETVTLEPGDYYDVEWSKLKGFMDKPDNNFKYIIQNPVGDIYYANDLTTAGEQTKFAGENQVTTEPEPTTEAEPTTEPEPTTEAEPTTEPEPIITTNPNELVGGANSWTRYQDNETKISYSPVFSSASLASDSGSNFKYYKGSSTVEFYVKGTGFKIIGRKNPLYTSNVEVKINDIVVGSLSQFSSTESLYQYVNFIKEDLPYNLYKVTLTNKTTDYFGIDAIDVINGSVQSDGLTWNKYDNTDSKISYIGSWTHAINNNFLSKYPHNNTISYSSGNASGSNYLTFSFTGSGIKLISRNWDSSYGAVTITIDGTPYTFTQLSATQENQVIQFEKKGLTNGLHTVKITAYGSYFFLMDAFEIAGTMN